MGLVLAVITTLLVLVLGLYVFWRHEDRTAFGAAVVLAVAVLAVWYVGERGQETLEVELDASRARIVELETAPAQRGFTDDARAGLVESLGQFVGPTAFVLANSPDVETTEFAREITSILKDAGWEVPPSFGMSYRPVLLPGQERVPAGVMLGFSDDVPDGFQSSIAAAFREGGVAIERGPHWPGTEHPISILVGPAR